MHYILDDTMVTITCTFAELCRMDSLAQAIYATPTRQGDANRLYMSRRAWFRYDFLLATVEDFYAAEGWSCLGWEDMSEEEQESRKDDSTSITVSRRQNLADV